MNNYLTQEKISEQEDLDVDAPDQLYSHSMVFDEQPKLSDLSEGGKRRKSVDFAQEDAYVDYVEQHTKE